LPTGGHKERHVDPKECYAAARPYRKLAPQTAR
jgi:hypothetical protein